MKKIRLLAAAVAAGAAALAATPALADLTIGVSISLTGPTSALGIPTQKGIALWPTEIAGEKLNVIVLDDATDPTKGVQNTRKLITEDKVDVIVGSVTTPVADRRWPTSAPRARRRSSCSRRRTCRRARTPGRSACRSRPR